MPTCAAETLEPRRLLTSGYLPLNLVSDLSNTALIQDSNLVNPWGLALNANSGDIWVADRGSGMASLYFGAIAGSPFQADAPAVSIPGGSPTGVTSNATNSFLVQSGSSSGPASFLFDSAVGDLAGWNQGVPPPSPSDQAQIGVSTSGAIYTGLALVNNAAQNDLYAADFHDNRIDVFNSSFQPVTVPGGFSDPGLPAGFAPYNIVNLGAQLLVCYAKQDASGQNAVAGSGNGALDLFDFNGVLRTELVVGQSLNAPWGAALAPSTFGDDASDLLVANSGNGQIEAFNPQSGALLGTLMTPSGTPLAFDGLRGLDFGNGSTAGNTNELFFSAGTDGGQHGLFGAIRSAQGAPLLAQGTALDATSGINFNATLAVFSDAQNLPASSFSASINWGDGIVTPGGISALADGGFAISGSHSYHSGGVEAITIQVSDSAGHTATAKDQARVASPGVNMTAQTCVATEGATFNGTVATFIDTDGNTSTDAYTATIRWDDGTTTAGTISFHDGKFSVIGSHVDVEEGVYPVTVKVTDLDGANASVVSKVDVADAPLSGTTTSIAATLGATFSGTVASFADADPNATLSDFTGTIDWGDGTMTAATIVSGAGGTFSVAGSHLFADAGTSTVSVTINDAGGAQVVAQDTANIVDIDVLGATLVAISPTEGTAFSGTVATVTDSNLATTAGALTATINWGDGMTTTGTVSGTAGAFIVSDNHTYTGEGVFTLSVVVAHVGGTATATAQETVTTADTGALSVSGAAFTATEGVTFTGEVATASDTYAAPAAYFTATIDWGDGTISAGSVTGQPGQFTVGGQHVYADEGTYSPVVSIADLAPGHLSATSTFTTVAADAPLSATAKTLNLTEGQAFAGTVASFLDANPPATIGDFSATIDWGDGTTNLGTVSAAGGFNVSGTHTYAIGGTYNATVTIDDTGGSKTVASSAVAVMDYPLTATGVSVAATEGQLFTGSVATFTDTNPDGGNVAAFSATIDWGDGTTSAGTVSAVSGGFIVTGTHLYPEEATENVSVTIQDVGGSKATPASTTVVVDDPLTAGPALALATTQGARFSGTVGTFTDANPGAATGDFTATIDWGDGSTATPGTVASAPGGGFLVSGVHTYSAEASSRTVQIVVNDHGGSQVTLTASAHVASNHFVASGVQIPAVEGTTFNGTVAMCNDSDPNAGDYSATIDWPDGSTSAGTVSAAAGGGFAILGSHVFADAGTSSVTVAIFDPALDERTVTSRANVADAPLTTGKMTFSATEGSTFAGTVATFADGNPLSTAANFTTTVTWGDGATSVGTVGAVAGVFVVSDTHLYAEEGIEKVSVTINDVGGSKTTAANTAVVVDAPLSVSPASVTVPTNGALNNLLLATFTDLGGAEPLTNYAATIDWGDGSSTSSGSIAQTGTVFQIAGSHTYQQQDRYTIQVMVRDEGGSTDTIDVQTTNPPLPDRLYIQALYDDVLARPADPSGLSYWLRQLQAGEPRPTFVNALDHSAEYFSNIIVTPAYDNYLGRAPDAQGLAFWVDQMQNHGLTDEQLEAGFISSPEFYIHAGNTDKAFIDALYQNLLGRTADAAGESYWIGQLAAGVSRTNVAYELAAGRERESERITDDYMHYLGRQPDAVGLNFWVESLANGVTNEQVITGFAASDEYFERHSHV